MTKDQMDRIYLAFNLTSFQPAGYDNAVELLNDIREQLQPIINDLNSSEVSMAMKRLDKWTYNTKPDKGSDEND